MAGVRGTQHLRLLVDLPTTPFWSMSVVMDMNKPTPALVIVITVSPG